MCLTGGGSEMCDITDCTAMRDVYRASGAGPTAVGDIVACQQASQVQCVTTQGGGGGGGVLPVPRQLGEPCDAGAACIAGATCDCAGICQNEVSIDVIAVGDDSVALWVCGTKIGVTAGMGQRETWSYTGPCPTLYYYATNNNWKTGITSAVQDLATNTIYPTQTDGSGLVGIVGVDVTDTTFFSDSSYDFSAWVPAVQSVDHQVRTPWMDMLAEFGSEAWSYKPTDQSGSDLVNTWYKVKIPMCA